MSTEPQQNSETHSSTPSPEQPAKALASESSARSSRSPWYPLAVILGLSAVFFFLFVGITGTIFLSDRFTGSEDNASLAQGIFNEGGIGIIEVDGVILDSKRVLKQLRRFAASDQVKAVVIRLDSPGGSVAPSQEIHDAVKRFPKPIVASMGSVAASGAFYVAVAAKKVIANPGTLTGSIGVIMEFANLSKLYEWAKIERYSLKTGQYKDAGAEYRPMDPESRQLLQGVIDGVLQQFKQAVVDGRKLTPAEVDAVADGRILSGAQAHERKLVDSLGTIEDAVLEAAQMAGIKGKPRWIYPQSERKNPFLDLFLEGEPDGSEARQSLDANAGVVRAIVNGVEKVTGAAALPPGIYWVWRTGVNH